MKIFKLEFIYHYDGNYIPFYASSVHEATRLCGLLYDDMLNSAKAYKKWDNDRELLVPIIGAEFDNK